jgi:ribosomal protein S18 acetylase RimI-like enzyme
VPDDPLQVEIVEASIADAAALSALAIKTYVDAFGADFEPDDLAHHLELSLSAQRWDEYLKRDRVFIARRGKQLVGYIQFGPTGRPGEMTIRRVYVLAELHGNGVGSRLLQRALSVREVVTADAVIIGVWEHNHGARRLYERYGFRHEGGKVPFVLKSGNVDGHDLILVRRRPA